LDPDGSIVISPATEETLLPLSCRFPILKVVGVNVEVSLPSVTSMLPVTSRLNVVAAKLTLPVS